MISNLDDYKEWYTEYYHKRPSEKLCESFCESNGLPWPPAPKKKAEEPKPLSDDEKKTFALQKAVAGLEKIISCGKDCTMEIARLTLEEIAPYLDKEGKIDGSSKVS